ncbi:hypothetical protein JYU34_003655 [Plutella xylostella]|uniref:Uncharacterized protein n=1 Tax=Plutella xylostella TaxID=51655 RepID=A0ABQ7R0P0_PLUXY|nr:hypothetical protein JYU34_003655 [Plutella xylostella]
MPDQRPSEHHQQLSAYSLDSRYAGVASVAGVASRDGRVSTLGAVSFLPRTGNFGVATGDSAHCVR